MTQLTAESGSLGELALRAFRGALSCPIAGDAVSIDSHANLTCLTYSCMSGVSRMEPTFIRLTFDRMNEEVWIGYLYVANADRGRGVGSAMAAAAEQMACDICTPLACVFPLSCAFGFWRKQGYRSHARRSHILVKTLFPKQLNEVGSE